MVELLLASRNKNFTFTRKSYFCYFLTCRYIFIKWFTRKSAGDFDTTGIILGLLSAVTFATYIFVSGKVAVEVPSLPRGVLLMAGALTLVMIVFPPTFILTVQFRRTLEIRFRFRNIQYRHSFYRLYNWYSKDWFWLSDYSWRCGTTSYNNYVCIRFKEVVLSSQWFGVSLILIGIAIPQIAYAMRGRYRKHHTHKSWQHKREDFHLRILSLLLYTYSKYFI